MPTANEQDPTDEAESPTPPDPIPAAAGGRHVADPALTPDRRQLIKRAQASLPEGATNVQIAARAIQMRHEEEGTSWVEQVDTGWTFGGDEVGRVLGR